MVLNLSYNFKITTRFNLKSIFKTVAMALSI